MSAELPSGWVLATVDDLARYVNGLAFKPSDWQLSGRPIIRIQNLTRNARFNHTTRQVSEDVLVRNGDILVSWSATLDAFVWRGPEAVLNQHIFKVIPSEHIRDHVFLRWALKNAIEELWASEHSHGTTMKHINRRPFLSHNLKLPPTREQTRIAETLESCFTRLDDAVATMERVQRNLRRYRASVLKAAVEGRLVPTEAELARAEGRAYEPASVLLERILAARRQRWEEAEVAKTKADGRRAKDDKWKAKYAEPITPDTTGLPELPDGWCWASLAVLLREELRNGHSAKRDAAGNVRTLTLSAVTERDFSARNTKLTAANRHQVRDLWLKTGDIFVERSNTPELVGTSALFTGPEDFAIFPDLLIRVRAVDQILAPYLEFVLRSDRVRQYFRRSAQGIAGTMPKISQDTLLRLTVPVPPTVEQARIVAEVDRLLSVAQHVEVASAASLVRTTRLRQSILKWAFEGRLVDQDPSDEPASILLERIRAERESADDEPARRRPRRTTRQGRTSKAPAAAGSTP